MGFNCRSSCYSQHLDRVGGRWCIDADRLSNLVSPSGGRDVTANRLAQAQHTSYLPVQMTVAEPTARLGSPQVQVQAPVLATTGDAPLLGLVADHTISAIVFEVRPAFRSLRGGDALLSPRGVNGLRVCRVSCAELPGLTTEPPAAGEAIHPRAGGERRVRTGCHHQVESRPRPRVGLIRCSRQ